MGFSPWEIPTASDWKWRKFPDFPLSNLTSTPSSFISWQIFCLESKKHLGVKQIFTHPESVWQVKSWGNWHWTMNPLDTMFHIRTVHINIIYSWFKVTFSSPSWRSLNPLKGSLNHPKKVTKNRQVAFFQIQQIKIHDAFKIHFLTKKGIT